MSSRFRAQREEAQRQLLSQLVQHVVCVDQSDENHATALGFCADNIAYHRFRDVDTKAVESDYQQLEERLLLHSQTYKATYLAALRQTLAALPPPDDVPDLPHAILSLLLNLSRQPLSTLYPGRSADVPARLHALLAPPSAQPPVPIPQAADEQAEQEESSEEEAYDGFSETSELSVWSDELESPQPADTAAATGPQPAAVAPAHEQQQQEQEEEEEDGAERQASAGAAPPFSTEPLEAVAPPADAPLVAPPNPVPKAAAAEEQDGSLAAKLLRPRAARAAPSRHDLPWGAQCVSDAFLTQQLLHALQGRPCVDLLRRDPLTGAYAFPPGLCTPYLSAASLHRLLQQCAATHGQLRWLHGLLDETRTGRLHSCQLTPGLAALAQAVAAQLQHALAPLVALELAHVALWHAGPVLEATQARQQAPEPLSLLSLLEASRGAMERVALLHDVMRRLLPTLRGPPAQLSACALDAVCGMLADSVLQQGSQAQLLQRCLLHLLLAMLSPLLDSLQRWLYSSHESQLSPDFFIAAVPLGPSDSVDDAVAAGPTQPSWQEAFTLVTDLDSKQPACPQFLRPMAVQIFAAGKSLRVLASTAASASGQRQQKQAAQGMGKGRQGAAAAMPAGDKPAGGRVPLVDVFVEEQPGSLAASVLAAAKQLLSNCSGGSHPQGPAQGHGAAAGSKAAVYDAMAAAGAGAAAGGPSGLLALAQQPGGGGALPPWSLLKQSALLSWGAWLQDSDSARGSDSGGGASAAGVGRLGADEDGGQQLEHDGEWHWVGEDAGDGKGDGEGDGGVLSLPSCHKALLGSMQRHGQRLQQQYLHAPPAAAGGQQPASAGGHAPADGAGAGAAPALARLTLHQQLQAALLPGGAASKAARHLAGALSSSQSRLAWLLDMPFPCGLPPVEVLLQACLLQPVAYRLEEVGQQLMGGLLSRWGLMVELTALRNLFLLATPLVAHWAEHRLLAALARPRGLADADCYSLEAALKDVAAEQQQGGGAQALPQPDAITLLLDIDKAGRARSAAIEERATAAAAAAAATASLAYGAAVTPGGGGSGAAGGRLSGSAPPAFVRSVYELEGVSLSCQPSWLVSLICGAPAMAGYNAVMQWLLQVRWAQAALHRARQLDWKAAQGAWRAPFPAAATAAGAATAGGSSGGSSGMGSAKQRELVLLEMSHFVAHLREFMVDRLLHAAWAQLEAGMDGARSLDEVRAVHGRYLATLLRLCGKGAQGGSDLTWRHIATAIRKCLNEVLFFCNAHAALHHATAAAQQQQPAGRQPPQQQQARGGGSNNSNSSDSSSASTLLPLLASAADGFRSRHRYLLSLVGTKTLRIGGDEQLEYLLMRLDFNGFYAASSALEAYRQQ